MIIDLKLPEANKILKKKFQEEFLKYRALIEEFRVSNQSQLIHIQILTEALHLLFLRYFVSGS